MNKLLAALLACSIAAMAHAADKSAPAPGFWEKLRMKIEQITPQKKSNTTTAVGGVRGAPVESEDVYWKGEAKPISIDPAELTAFQGALTLVNEGKKEQARAAFSEFAKKYPDSPLRKDAEQAMAMLQQK